MSYDITNILDINLSVQNRLLIPPIVLCDKIFFISNPRFFLLLYKIGKLSDFMSFAETYGYDEIKSWLRSNHLLLPEFLESVSLYSVFCKIKHARRMRFFVKDFHARVERFELN